jgi:hypothetical protein
VNVDETVALINAAYKLAGRMPPYPVADMAAVWSLALVAVEHSAAMDVVIANAWEFPSAGKVRDAVLARDGSSRGVDTGRPSGMGCDQCAEHGMAGWVPMSADGRAVRPCRGCNPPQEVTS